MMNAEWVEYTGSDDQKEEILIAGDVLFRYKNGYLRLKSTLATIEFFYHNLRSYLICNPHPLADMICQQAQTGQPVWVRRLFNCGIEKEWQVFCTATPDWYIPNAQYSFMPFDE